MDIGHGKQSFNYLYDLRYVLMFKTGRFDPKVISRPKKNLFVDEYFDTLVDLEGGETPVTQAANADVARA
jgi:hypothetical protein